jgi:hypothetical protein
MTRGDDADGAGAPAGERAGAPTAGLGPAGDAAVRAPACPFCDSPAVELVSPWGGQLITAQWRCLGCASYFEAVREAFDDDASAEPRLSG